MILFGIYREPGPMARANRRRYDRIFSPDPKRVAVIEAENETAALEAFVKAEQIRSKHVRDGSHVIHRGTLHVTLVNGQHSHVVRYQAWRRG